ncbi:MAG: aminodeoxychorismate lyase [Gammaproteobacteria bacterium]|nr:aminodeoxychorismate lyase [Gammaproteobacteria bacterium]
MTSKCMINGVATDHLLISDRSIHYGDGLFETILCSDNRLYYWPQHYQRLRTSAEKLKIVCPDEQTLLQDITELVSSNGAAEHRVIKILLSRGLGERGYSYTRDISANRMVLLSGLNASYSSILNGTLLAGELFICDQQVSINESLAGMKHLNRLENVMARNEWHDRKAAFIDGLMLNADHEVIEGTMSNLFAVRDGQVFTPVLDRSGIRGVMRDAIVELAAKNRLPLSEARLTVEDLLTMDELFITNSLIGMKRVTKLGDTIYKDFAVTDLIFKTLLVSIKDYVQAV